VLGTDIDRRVPTVVEESSKSAEAAQDATDRLALALEEAGFDVGRAFPGLQVGWDEAGVPGVRLGTVNAFVASDLAAFLEGAVSVGMTLPPR
jgi:hypothetical protein